MSEWAIHEKPLATHEQTGTTPETSDVDKLKTKVQWILTSNHPPRIKEILKRFVTEIEAKDLESKVWYWVWDVWDNFDIWMGIHLQNPIENWTDFFKDDWYPWMVEDAIELLLYARQIVATKGDVDADELFYLQAVNWVESLATRLLSGLFSFISLGRNNILQQDSVEVANIIRFIWELEKVREFFIPNPSDHDTTPITSKELKDALSSDDNLKEFALKFGIGENTEE